jgi:ABC-2 type transport system ATP-binding protein|tara:strand:- start:4704 stop:5657 length:954 start_codon:yes stop_codon:yes gene_type:complete
MIKMSAENLPENAINIKDLKKEYKNPDGKGTFLALDSISVTIPRGSIFGLLGPNGAGKSTFINILAGLAIKTSGEAIIWGNDIDKHPKASRSSLGVVPQELTIDPFFSPKESLEQQAGLYGVRPKERNVDYILKMLDLDDKAEAYSRTLSGGMRRRLLVAKAMVHRPPILILDEPTAGVDIELRQQLWHYVRKLNENGTTIILTTHYLEEAEELCDTIAILDHGKIVRCAPTQELLEDVDLKTITLKASGHLDINNETLKKMKANVDNNIIEIHFNPKVESSREILAEVENSGVVVSDFEVKGSSLETAFLSITSKK